MARPEIVRELVLNPENGKYEWKTVVDTAGGAGSGTVALITSSDLSVTISNPSGPTVDLSVSGGGGGAPTGPAGGVLSGTYPDPGFAVDMATQTELNSEASARAAADALLTPQTRTITAGTGLTGGGNLSADRTLTVTYGVTAGTAAQGNDSRLSDSRAPSGAAGGSLAGTYPNPTIAANAVGTTQIADTTVTDNKVNSEAAANGQVLTANGGGAATWQNPAGGAPSGAAGGDLTGTYPDPTITSGSAGAGNVLTADGASGTVWASPPGTALLPASLLGFVNDWDGTTGTNNDAAWVAMVDLFASEDSNCAVQFDVGGYYFETMVEPYAGDGQWWRVVGVAPPIYNQTPNPNIQTLFVFGSASATSAFDFDPGPGVTIQSGFYFEYINFINDLANGAHADNVCVSVDRTNNWRLKSCGSQGFASLVYSESNNDNAHGAVIDCICLIPAGKIGYDIPGGVTNSNPGGGFRLSGGSVSGGAGAIGVRGGPFADAMTIDGDVKFDGCTHGAVVWKGQHLIMAHYRIEASSDAVNPVTSSTFPPISVQHDGALAQSGSGNQFGLGVIVGTGGSAPIWFASDTYGNQVYGGTYDGFVGGSDGFIQNDSSANTILTQYQMVGIPQIAGSLYKFKAFGGGNGVVRPVIPLTTPDVQDVIDALVSLGWASQSD